MSLLGDTCKARRFRVVADNGATPAQVECLSAHASCYTRKKEQEKSTWRNNNHSGSLSRSFHSSRTILTACSRLRRSNTRHFSQPKRSHTSLTILRSTASRKPLP